MEIVVVDGATLNPGDLSWKALESLGTTEIYDHSTRDELLIQCKNAQIVITNKVVFDKQIIEQLANLRYIGVTATGYNIIDIDAASKRGIVVTNVPTYGTASVAQMVFALLLELCHHVGHHSSTVHEGKWCKSNNFCYWDKPLVELGGLTMGIIGCGKIGLAVANIANAFGMKVIGFDTMAVSPDAKIQVVDINSLFKNSDVISLHCPLTAETKHIINAKNLAMMKSSAFIINTSRGTLVNESDLADALNSGKIAGAAVDVLSAEPPTQDNPLLTAKNCYITPHIAWATYAARKRLLDISVENVKSYLSGKAINVINK